MLKDLDKAGPFASSGKQIVSLLLNACWITRSVLPACNAEAIGEADKVTAWDNTTLKINNTRARLWTQVPIL